MSRAALLLTLLLGGSARAEERWWAGDLHMHVSPPDRRVSLDARETAERAHAAGLDFVVLTPHLGPRNWRDPQPRARFLAAFQEIVAFAAAEERLTLIPGAEYGEGGLGHFGISGVDFGRFSAERSPLEQAHAAGAFIVVNHPFSLPLDILGIDATHRDMSYEPWTHGKPGFSGFQGVEVWNVPLAMGNLVSRPGGGSNETLAFARADEVARRTGRKLTVVGGTDNHQAMIFATTWVRARDRSAASILGALRAGAVCIGGPEAGSLAARGDRDAAPVGIGGTVRAARRVVLTFTGEARVFVDGVDRGLHRDRFVAAIDGGRHSFRITAGASRSGFVWANF